MSYEAYLCDPVTKEPLMLDVPHQLRGGTHAKGGIREAWLNITYNYAPHYYTAFGELGVRSICGMSGAESIPVLKNAISKLGDEVSKDYWEPKEGNAKQALHGLLALAQMRPDGIWCVR